MLLNYETVIVGERCVLVPYRKEHVAKYHEWMQDVQLLEATASEPLSLEQEYEMQQTWRDDPNKCTFIVLDRQAVDEDLLALCMKDSEEAARHAFIQSSLSAMAGDVNMFLSDEESENDTEEEDESGTAADRRPHKQAEIDIMIAVNAHRRKGLGREATCLMMYYCVKQLQLRRIFCKINETNEASLQLFTSLGFVQCAHAKCFCEVELELRRDDWTTLLHVIDGLLGSIGPRRTFRCPVVM